MDNRHIQFWLIIGSLITFVMTFVFMLGMAALEEVSVIFKKEYCLFFIPILIYLMFQFIVNYCNLTDKENENK